MINPKRRKYTIYGRKGYVLIITSDRRIALGVHKRLKGINKNRKGIKK